MSALGQEPSIWDYDNLVASAIDTDDKNRSAGEKARFLRELGVRKVALGGGLVDRATVEADIAAYTEHGVEIFSYGLPDTLSPVAVDWRTQSVGASADDGLTFGTMLDIFAAAGVRPQLWLARPAPPIEPGPKPYDQWDDADRDAGFRRMLGYDMPTTAAEHRAKITAEVEHVRGLVELAGECGHHVAIYKHGGWIGIAANQVSVIEELKDAGSTNVGLVFRFIRSRDEIDEVADFPETWRVIREHTSVVDLTGLHARRTVFPILYPGEGELELDLMRIVEDSGWRGTVGISAEKWGDAELNIRNNLRGLDWLRAELDEPGSGGRNPFASGD